MLVNSINLGRLSLLPALDCIMNIGFVAE